MVRRPNDTSQKDRMTGKQKERLTGKQKDRTASVVLIQKVVPFAVSGLVLDDGV